MILLKIQTKTICQKTSNTIRLCYKSRILSCLLGRWGFGILVIRTQCAKMPHVESVRIAYNGYSSNLILCILSRNDKKITFIPFIDLLARIVYKSNSKCSKLNEKHFMYSMEYNLQVRFPFTSNFASIKFYMAFFRT